MNYFVAAIILGALTVTYASPVPFMTGALCTVCSKGIGEVEKIAKMFPAVVNALTANEEAFCSLLPGAWSNECQTKIAGKLADINKALVDQEDPEKFCTEYLSCSYTHKPEMEVASLSVVQPKCNRKIVFMCLIYCEFGNKLDSQNCPVCACRSKEEMSDCQSTRYMAQLNKMMGAFVPRCNEDGTYAAKQCREGACACHTSTGTPFTSWIAATQELNCECPRDVQDASVLPPIGTYTPRCETDGHYSKVQCHGSTGFCWCADPKSGEKVTEPSRQRPTC